MININPICSCAKIVPAEEFGEPKFIAMAPWFFCSSGSNHSSGQNQAGAEQSISAVWSGTRCSTGTAGRIAGAAGFVPGTNSPLMGKCNQIMHPLNYCSLRKKWRCPLAAWDSVPVTFRVVGMVAEVSYAEYLWWCTTHLLSQTFQVE